MSLFAPLLPGDVRSVESRQPTTTAEFAAEAELVAGAAPSRQHQFWTGRALARDALAQLDHPREPIGRDSRGAPHWPAGVAGSITHTDRYAAVAVASSATYSSLGIDAEPIVLLPPEVVVVVTNPREQQRLQPVAGDHSALLAFVAKEAVFKAWWPWHGHQAERELDFADVALFPHEEDSLVAEHRAGEWLVRWGMAEGMLLAAVAVPA